MAKPGWKLEWLTLLIGNPSVVRCRQKLLVSSRVYTCVFIWDNTTSDDESLCQPLCWIGLDWFIH